MRGAPERESKNADVYRDIEEMIEEINLLDSIANSDEAHDDTSSGLKKPNPQG